MQLKSFYKKSKFKISRNLSSYALEYQKRLLENPTKAEMAFQGILESLKIPYLFQEIFHVFLTFFIVDFYVSHANIGFEIDGEYHFSKKRKKLDLKREQELYKFHGIRIYRWTNKEVFEKRQEIEEILKKIIPSQIVVDENKKVNRIEYKPKSLKPYVVAPKSQHE